MGTAYTPGLTVSPDHYLVKQRRLPIAGEVLVEKGDEVRHDTVVARAELPGEIETVRLAERMQLDPDELTGKVKVKAGDNVKRGDILAVSQGIFGLFRSEVTSPVDGTVEFFTEASGHLGIRRPPRRIEVDAYIPGRIIDVEPGQGVTVRSRGAFVQGIFGVGGGRHGQIYPIDDMLEGLLTHNQVNGDVAGKIIVAGGGISADALRKAAELGAAGAVVGCINDQDLAQYLGYDIGVAITGDENIPLTLILTEGFGQISMAKRTFDLLCLLRGRFAAINGTTQIRAGAVRPEIFVPHDETGVPSPELLQAFRRSHPAPATAAEQWDPTYRTTGTMDGASTAVPHQLECGTTVRAVRQPHFGKIGVVTELPARPVRVPSGAVVRVLKMKLPNGEEIVLPRSNVEILDAL